MVPTRHVVSGWVVGGHHERVREAVIKYPHSSRNLKDTGTLYVEWNFSQWVSSPASRAIVLRDPLKAHRKRAREVAFHLWLCGEGGDGHG